MPREELRSRLAVAGPASSDVIDRLEARGVLLARGTLVALPTYVPALSAEEMQAANDYLALLGTKPHSPPTDRAPSDELLALLIDRGDVVRVGDDIVFAADAYNEMVARITERLRADGPLMLAEARDMLGTSRRYAQALLEHLDSRKITRRVGDARVLR